MMHPVSTHTHTHTHTCDYSYEIILTVLLHGHVIYGITLVPDAQNDCMFRLVISHFK
jgi:hypothetical protein